MKTNLGFVVFFLMSSLNAQDVIFLEQDTVSAEFCDLSWPNSFYELQLELNFRNLTNDSISINWRREYDSECPSEWSVAIVDPNLSYVPSISESALPIMMAPLDSNSYVILSFYPDETAGACDAKIIFYLDDDVTNPLDTGYYHLAVNTDDCINTSILNIEKEKVNIYPNPSSDLLFIESVSILKSMMITDLKGATCIEDLSFDSKIIDVSDLPPGMYMITFVTERGFIHNAKFYKD